ncbi:MAG: adenylate/guanylate cyclase domain-containing protein [Acidimicrobiia bacterium]
MTDRPSGTVTFLFTDIEGSTDLLQRLGDEYADVVAAHFQILRAAIDAHGGTEESTDGDSLFAVFPSAVEAVGAAIDAQRELSEYGWSEGSRVLVRMGLHSGEATYRQDGYVGLDVHRAARISAVAHGGQIVSSASTTTLAAQATPPEVSFRPLGDHRLKDLREAEHLSQVVAPGLGTEFPPLRSLDVVPNNLPIHLTNFVGRKAELAEVGRLLSDGRLVTLTGVGGTGKTRLALQSAAEVVHDFPDGVWAVDLAPVAEDEMVDNALAAAMGVRDQPGRSLIETIGDVLLSKKTLIVFDNCEHVLAVSAELVSSILRSGSGVKVLTTSREALGVAGEVTYPVPSLRAPPSATTSAEDLMGYDAVVLFEDRATLARPDFKITDANAQAVAQICRKLDAVPLAIELAAARVRILSPSEIADRLDDRFRLLTGGDRTAMPRQQTLEATVTWSYDQLSDQEQLMFARLAVFAGSLDLAAAEEVAGFDGIEKNEVLDLVTGLIEKSMLVVQSDDEAGTRYRLLETLRQYARSRLIEGGDVEGLRLRHARYFADLAEEGDEGLRGPGQLEAFRRLEREHSNLTIALTWALGAGESELFLRIASALGYLWGEIGHWEEARRWLLAAPVFDDTQRADLRAKALVAAEPVTVPEDPARAREIAEQALGLSKAAGEDRLAASALRAMGDATIYMFLPEEAVSLLEESLAISRSLDDRWGEAVALGSLANALNPNEPDEAAELSEQSQRVFEDLGDELKAAESLYRTASIANSHDRASQAIEPIGKALSLYRKLGAVVGQGHSLNQLGLAMTLLSRWAGARDAFVESLSLLNEAGDAHCSALVQRHLGMLDLYDGQLASARERLREALVVSLRIDDKLSAVAAMEGLGHLAAMQDSAERGAELFGAANRMRDEIKVTRSFDERWFRSRGLDELHRQLDDSSFTAAWERGATMSSDEAVAYALE